MREYQVQLKKGPQDVIAGYIAVEGATPPQQVELSIAELNLKKTLTTDEHGVVVFEIEAKPQLWEPASPKMYHASVSTGGDTVQDEIAFRTIETKGTDILLNGKPVFLKGVNFHEEIPQRMGRAYSEADAAMILHEVKALGCNFVRTAHYPQNERIVRMAEKMLREMVYRDKNRGGIIIWSIANETRPSDYRDRVLTELVALTHRPDSTRLVGAEFDNLNFDRTTSTFTLNDKVSQAVDVVGANKYMGWYLPFPVGPEQVKWNVAADKPLIISEFGWEALYGQHGTGDVAHSWSEECQEDVYRRNLVMFQKYLQPARLHAVGVVRFSFTHAHASAKPRRLESQGPPVRQGPAEEGVVRDEGVL